jgi:hypothetical protein
MLHQVGYFLAWVEWCEADLIPYKAFSVAGFGAIFSISQAFSGSECFLAGPSSGGGTPYRVSSGLFRP